MNIFKVLANGDGSINEPNVSAFLVKNSNELTIKCQTLKNLI